MARRIEIKGPFRYVLVSLLILFVAGNWLVPDLLAGLTGSGSRSWRLLRSGHVERYHRNLLTTGSPPRRGCTGQVCFPCSAART
jgi:hypothetical protein